VALAQCAASAGHFVGLIIILATKVYQPMGLGPNDRRLSAYSLLRDAVPLLHLRRLRASVDVGGVEEVDSRIDRGVHDREAARLVHGEAEVHGAEADPADQQT
jgi:hypothetical protein